MTPGYRALDALGPPHLRTCEGEPVSDEIGSQPTETEEVRSTALAGDWELRGQRAPKRTGRDELPYPRVRPKMER